jgi:hypothetical protein
MPAFRSAEATVAHSLHSCTSVHRSEGMNEARALQSRVRVPVQSGTVQSRLEGAPTGSFPNRPAWWIIMRTGSAEAPTFFLQETNPQVNHDRHS